MIADNDGTVVTIVATDPNASEAGLDPGEFTVTRTGGNLAEALAVIISRGGTANNGSDYASLGGANFVVSFAPNQTTAAITITPLPDPVAEGDETVVLTIVSRTVYTIGTPGSATVIIAGP